MPSSIAQRKRRLSSRPFRSVIASSLFQSTPHQPTTKEPVASNTMNKIFLLIVAFVALCLASPALHDFDDYVAIALADGRAFCTSFTKYNPPPQPSSQLSGPPLLPPQSFNSLSPRRQIRLQQLKSVPLASKNKCADSYEILRASYQSPLIGLLQGCNGGGH